MTKARKWPAAIARRYGRVKLAERKAARKEQTQAWGRFQVVRGAGTRPGGRKIRVSLRTRKAFLAVFASKDKWSRGRAAERLFKSFGGDLGTEEAVTLNWVESKYTLGVYHRLLDTITLAHDQPDLRDTIIHEMTHWADVVAGISDKKVYGSHTRLFYVRIGWLKRELER